VTIPSEFNKTTPAHTTGKAVLCSGSSPATRLGI